MICWWTMIKTCYVTSPKHVGSSRQHKPSPQSVWECILFGHPGHADMAVSCRADRITSVWDELLYIALYWWYTIPTPLKNMSSSVGMMKFPTEWKIPTPRKNDGVRQLGWIFHSQLFMESHEQFHGSSHHQPVLFWGPKNEAIFKMCWALGWFPCSMARSKSIPCSHLCCFIRHMHDWHDFQAHHQRKSSSDIQP